MPKNPRTPPAEVIRDERHVARVRDPLWRLHRVIGEHALAWNALRTFGPAATMRWDPHPEPRGDHPGTGVSYAASDVSTTFAEVFQRRRAITLSSDLALSGWIPTRDLRLLDLRSDWALRNGASVSLHAAPKSTCRAWSRAIHETWPDLDGVLTPSTMTGSPMVVLFTPSASAFPARPALARLLDDPALRPIVDTAQAALGWPVLP